jgi:hypothetical protein
MPVVTAVDDRFMTTADTVRSASQRNAIESGLNVEQWLFARSPSKGDLSQLAARAVACSPGSRAQPIWEWARVQLVSNGLSLREIGVEELALTSLAIAEAWAAAGDL